LPLVTIKIVKCHDRANGDESSLCKRFLVKYKYFSFATEYQEDQMRTTTTYNPKSSKIHHKKAPQRKKPTSKTEKLTVNPKNAEVPNHIGTMQNDDGWNPVDIVLHSPWIFLRILCWILILTSAKRNDADFRFQILNLAKEPQRSKC
jgi:hypothetical protein